MKNTLLFLIFSLLFTVTNLFAQTPPTTKWSNNASTLWYNTTSTQFTLSSAEDLAGLSVLVAGGNTFSGKVIIIGGNINLSAHLWTPIGVDPSHPFSGSVDGKGFSISKLFIVDTTADFVGLFGRCLSASLSNITLDSTYLRISDTGGSLVGSFATNGTIENCHATGVDIDAKKYNVGGLVGELIDNSTMKRCSSEGKVVGVNQIGGLLGTPYNLTNVSECYSKGTVNAHYLAGGLIGFSTFAMGSGKENTINNCYSRANVSVTTGRAGGLVGGTDAQMIINNSYATGTATGPEYNGGLVGYAGSVTTLNNYWDEETSALTDAVGGWQGSPQTVDITPKTSAFMKTAAMVTLLNQNQTAGPWKLNPALNDGYPVFTDGTASIASFNKSNIQVSVYPSPFTDYITVESENMLTSYSLKDISGKSVQQGALNGNKSKIETQAIGSGMYILLINSDKGSLTHKIIK